jgi:hypothetical protein
MIKHIKRIAVILVINVVLLILVANPVFAIANPTSISFGSGTYARYNVFENAYETGDMLFVAEGFTNYGVEPTDYTASQAFLFQVLNTTGTTVLLATTLQAYGDRPISIYQTAAQVTALGLVSGTAYGLRITGNPAIFASTTGNTVTAYLSSGDYIDQSTSTETINHLKIFCLAIAENMEAEDAATYIVTVQGIEYLNTTAGSLFLEGIPQLSSFCPTLFQSSLAYLTGDIITTTGVYAGGLTIGNAWNTTVSNGLTNLGTYLGIGQGMGGSVVLMLLACGLAFYVFRRTDSGIATTSILATMPFAGAYLGLMPLALAFVVAFFIFILMMWFFTSRGAL